MVTNVLYLLSHLKAKYLAWDPDLQPKLFSLTGVAKGTFQFTLKETPSPCGTLICVNLQHEECSKEQCNIQRVIGEENVPEVTSLKFGCCHDPLDWSKEHARIRLMSKLKQFRRLGVGEQRMTGNPRSFMPPRYSSQMLWLRLHSSVCLSSWTLCCFFPSIPIIKLAHLHCKDTVTEQLSLEFEILRCWTRGAPQHVSFFVLCHLYQLPLSVPTVLFTAFSDRQQHYNKIILQVL